MEGLISPEDVQEVLDRLGVTQTELGRLTRVSRQQISHLVRGKHGATWHYAFFFSIFCRKRGLNDIARRIEKRLNAGDLL